MIPVNQSILHDPENGKNSDCHRACIASVLELPIEMVPHFEDMEPREGMREQLKLLASHKYTLYRIYGNPAMGDHPDTQYYECEYYFAVGASPRDRNLSHQVVCCGGKIVHDPHPDKSGLASISHFEMLLKL